MERLGPITAANELLNTVVNYDNWFEQLIPALREVGYNALADRLDDPVDRDVAQRPSGELRQDREEFQSQPASVDCRAKSKMVPTMEGVLIHSIGPMPYRVYQCSTPGKH